MTSIEWLIEQLQAPCRGIPSHIIEQAKEMHKQEIIDAYNKSFELRDKPYSTADKYYQETFVSKGSDETPEAPVTYKVDTWTSFHHDKERIINAQISDEEIEKAADKYVSKDDYNRYLECFKQGAFWYREQLKSIDQKVVK